MQTAYELRNFEYSLIVAVKKKISEEVPIKNILGIKLCSKQSQNAM